MVDAKVHALRLVLRHLVHGMDTCRMQNSHLLASETGDTHEYEERKQ